MATPITWRQMAAPDQRDSISLFRQGGQQVNQGLNGLSNTISGIAAGMEADQRQAETDQLNSVLNQIQQMNTLGQASAALNNGFVANSGLTPEQQLQARTALQNQITGNRSRTNATQQFDDAQLNRSERDTVGAYQEALVNGDLATANQLLGGLSQATRGRLAPALAQAQTQADQRNFMNDAFTRIQQIPALNATAEQLRRDMPIYAEDIVVENGQLRARQGGALDQQFLDEIVAQRYPNAVTSAPTTAQLGLELLQEGTNRNISPQQVMGLQQMLSGVVGADPVIQRNTRQQELQNQLNQRLNEINTEEALARNPVDPTLTPIEGESKEDVYAKYRALTETENEYFSLGAGDYAAFTEAADSVVNEGYVDASGEKQQYDPRAIDLALGETAAVREAQLGGNLGDTGIWGWLGSDGDNINTDEFKLLLDKYQAAVNANQTRRAANAETRRQAARNEITYQGLAGN